MQSRESLTTDPILQHLFILEVHTLQQQKLLFFQKGEEGRFEPGPTLGSSLPVPPG